MYIHRHTERDRYADRMCD